METKPRPPIRDALEYARDYYADPSLLERWGGIIKYCPEVFEGYMTLRQGAFMPPPHGALSLKYKELLCVAIENAGVTLAEMHARRAIEAGATLQELMEVLSICIQLRGMVTFQRAGRFTLKAAEERARELGVSTEGVKGKPRPPLHEAWQYARDYYGEKLVSDVFTPLIKYCPEVFQGYMTLRQGAFMAPPNGGLPWKYKELTAVAVECASVIPATGHARRAVDAGATAQEIAEVVALCIQLRGMVTYVHCGRFAIVAAEEREKELAQKAAQKVEK